MGDEDELGVTKFPPVVPTEITPLEAANFRMRCLELAAKEVGVGDAVEKARDMMAFVLADSPGPPPPPPPPHP